MLNSTLLVFLTSKGTESNPKVINLATKVEFESLILVVLNQGAEEPLGNVESSRGATFIT